MKRIKIKLNGIIAILFMFSGILFLFSSLFLKSYNQYLNVSKQKYQNQIAEIKTQNETLSLEISQLSTYDRVASIAVKDGMTIYNNQVVTVSNNE